MRLDGLMLMRSLALAGLLSLITHPLGAVVGVPGGPSSIGEAAAAVVSMTLLPGAAASEFVLPDGRTHAYWSWGVEALNVPALWAAGHTGAGVRVAVVDSGIDLDHPYLADQVAWGKSLCNYTTSPDDDYGHGTYVAGVVKQVAPDVTFYAIKMLSEVGLSGAGSACPGSVTEAMVVGAAGPDGVLGTGDDAHIVTASIGILFPGAAYATLFRDRFETAYAGGVTFVAAAGNEYASAGVVAPAAYPTVVAVAALGSQIGERDFVAEYSSNGITDGDDDTITTGEVEVAAPGSEIVSTWNNGGHANASGTSAAAPHVTGLLALLKGAQPASGGDALRARLACSAEDLPLNGKLTTPGYDVSSGYGRPDAGRLLAGPCHEAVPLSAMPAVIDERVSRYVDGSDYDGDGLEDTVDKVNLPSEALAFVNGTDYVQASFSFGEPVTLTAPDGRSLLLVPRADGPAKVYLDKRVGSGNLLVQGDSLVGAPADGTWTVKQAANFVAFGRATTLVVQGKTLQMLPCCGDRQVSIATWNWHRTEGTYEFGGFMEPPTAEEENALYGRFYVE